MDRSPRTSRLATAALAAAGVTVIGPLLGEVLANTGLVPPLAVFLVGLVVVGPMLAVILGVLALQEIRRSSGEVAGRGMALAAVIFGVLALAAVSVLVVLFAVALHNFQF